MLARSVECGQIVARSGVLPVGRASELVVATTGTTNSYTAAGIAVAVASVVLFVGSVFAIFVSNEPATQTPPAQSQHATIPSQPESKKPTTTVTGVVRGPDGAPVSGAQVVAFKRQPFEPGERGLRDNLLATATTDVNGRFALQVPDQIETWFQGPVVTLHISSSGLAPATRPIRLEAKPKGIELNLAVASPLRAKLVDEKMRKGNQPLVSGSK